MNWYYAYYNGGHTTRDMQFASDLGAIAFFKGFCGSGLESVEKCIDDGCEEQTIYLSEAE
jgi:hypothetical protein